MNPYLKRNLGLIIILILSLFPILIWLFIEPLSNRFFDWKVTFTSLGQIAGLVGISLFSINLIISSKLKIIDHYFLGMDKAYQIHKHIGAIAFSLMLFHPLFLVVKFLQASIISAALFFIPGQDLANTFGIIAILIFILLMVFTFYIKIKYNYWKISHKFTLLVFILILFHILLINSDISRSNILMAYILTLSILGLLGGSYRVILRKWLNHDLEFLIISVKELNNQIIEIEAEPVDRSILFKPGQFVYVQFNDPKIRKEIHPFSLASSNTSKNITLVIKSVGDFTSKLRELTVGTTFYIEGPLGYFSHQNYSSKKQLWIAGGIGITPFLSMVNDLIKQIDNEVDLYYCTRDNTESIKLDELIKISDINKKFNIITWYSKEKGQITGNRINEITKDLLDREVFICGPKNFYIALSKQLHYLGVKKSRIHLENFNLL